MKLRYPTDLKEWFDRNFTFKGLGVLLWLLFTLFPTWAGYKDFWVNHLAWVGEKIWKYNTLFAVLLAVILIWLDHRRVIQKRGPRPRDVKTVKGRTLQLRDDLQKLLDESVSKWPEQVQGAMLEPHDTSALENSFRRRELILHTFALRFQDRSVTIYHECGLAGTANDSFLLRLQEGIASSTKLRELIGDLDWMAKHVGEQA